MLLIPHAGPSDGPVVPVVDGLPLQPLDVGLESEVIVEDVEALFAGAREGPEAIVERQGAIPQLVQYRLQDNDIVEGRFVLDDVHAVEEDVCVGDDVVALGEGLVGGGVGGESEGLDPAIGVGGGLCGAAEAELGRAGDVLAQVEFTDDFCAFPARGADVDLGGDSGGGGGI